MRHDESERIYAKACELMPGGVNSPVRAFLSVGGTPIYFKRGEGAWLFDVDGNKYADFCCSWGPLLLGHARREIVEAASKAAADGLSFGACAPGEVEMAELVRRQVPYLEMLRMTSSGTEAVMTAIRLARGFTGRSKIIKFEGCYHGHSDSLLVSAGSGLLTGGISSSKGVTDRTASDTIVIPYNDLEALKGIASDVAAIIVEPIAGNMGLVRPKPGFLNELRKAADKSGALLLFDEVITGFRFGPTTVGHHEGVTPDLTTLGKIIGGGMPAGAVGGRTEIMRHLAPLGPVYQAGTLSGNPVSLAAGIATLKLAIAENPYPRMSEQVKRIATTINALKLPVHCAVKEGVFTIFFTAKKPPLLNLSEVKTCDTAKYAAFFHEMLERGFYLPPSQFEICFVSAAHDDTLTNFFAKSAVDAIKKIFN